MILGAFALACSSLVPASRADAAFPGENGLIAFVGAGGHRNPDGQINVIRLGDRSWHRRVTNLRAGSLADPAFSPSGRSIVYSVSGSRRAGIWIMRADGSHKHRIAARGHTPSFSPSGNRIVFSLKGICVMRRDGSHRHCLTDPVGRQVSDSEPVFSPHGGQIVFTRLGRTVNTVRIMTMRPGGTDVRPLTRKGRYPRGPEFSPNGRRIAYARTYGKKQGIWVMRADGSHQRRITKVRQGRALDSEPTFSPDGFLILFTRARRHGAQLYTMHPDGSDKDRLRKRIALYPSWGPA